MGEGQAEYNRPYRLGDTGVFRIGLRALIRGGPHGKRKWDFSLGFPN